jgi:hypothetical protein
MEQEEQQRPGQRALELIRVLLPNWQPTTEDVLRWIRLALAVGLVILGVLLILDIIGLLFGITLLNLLKVLAIPITVGAAVPLLNWLQKKRELDVENQRAQDEALQAYLDQMWRLLVDKERPLRRSRSQRKDDLSVMAEAWTSSVLARLDGRRKQTVLLFLQDAGLIITGHVVVSLAGVNLREAELSGPYQAFIDLRRADLTWADLSGADLSGASLFEASLRSAKLREADLSEALLITTDVREADLSGADLRWADLSGVIGLTEEQLTSAKSFEYAIMPDGQKYRDWVVDSPQGQRWLKKYKNWLETPEGQNWINTYYPEGHVHDGENSGL